MDIVLPGLFVIQRLQWVLIAFFSGPNTLRSRGCNLWCAVATRELLWNALYRIPSLWWTDGIHGYSAEGALDCLLKHARFSGNAEEIAEKYLQSSNHLGELHHRFQLPFKECALKWICGKTKKGDRTSPWADIAIANVTRVPRSADVSAQFVWNRVGWRLFEVSEQW